MAGSVAESVSGITFFIASEVGRFELADSVGRDAGLRAMTNEVSACSEFVGAVRGASVEGELGSPWPVENDFVVEDC